MCRVVVAVELLMRGGRHLQVAKEPGRRATGVVVAAEARVRLAGMICPGNSLCTVPLYYIKSAHRTQISKKIGRDEGARAPALPPPEIRHCPK